MLQKEIAKKCMTSLLEVGIEKAQVFSGASKKYELNVGAGEISLLRTTLDTNLAFIGIENGKKGTLSLNKSDEESIKNAASTLSELCKTAEADECNDIASNQPVKEFKKGGSEPDLDKMYTMLKNFTTTVKERYPQVILEEINFHFLHTIEVVVNSNNVDLQATKGIYNLGVMFSSKEEEKSSSFNYTGYSTCNLDKELIDCSSINALLKQSVDHLNPMLIEGKFLGDIIITPNCLSEMIEFYIEAFLSDDSLLSGTSLLRDKLNEQVTNPKFTLHSSPVSEEIEAGYFITKDGFEAKNCTIIEKGILKTFMLSQYAANKTKGERALNDGNAFIVEPGESSFDEMVKSIDKGILLCRFSGGDPAANGDFSGVAKNSYYIENGEIKYPISETMISANLYTMFNAIKAISKERINFGNALLPWISTTDVTISGK